jgi:glycerol-3-phosphate O-acyltransferase
LDLQGRVAGAIAVLPMFILYDRTQRRTIRPFWESFLGDPDRPGWIKRFLMAIRKWTVPELLVGEPVHLLGEFEEFGSDKSWEELPFEVRQELIAGINARIRVNRGPERRSRTEIKELVLQDAKLQEAVQEAMTRENAAEMKIRKKVESYVEEIAGDQHIQVHHMLYYVLQWIFNNMFDGVEIKESQFAMLKERNQQGSLIMVSCHKSHLDYLLVGFLCFVNQMAIPYMGAGKNLSFWPVGPVLRNAGAFFLRRSFKGKELYKQVFAAYLKVLIQEKINMNFYIEGGRSRTGKLMPPRLGMLTFILQAVEEGAVDDLLFVPTFLGYDQVPEEKSYLRELAGRDKQKETVMSVIKARELLRKRFGKAYIRFHEPLSFKDFCVKRGVDTSYGQLSLDANRKLIEDFAYHVMSGIVESGVVTPIDLLAAGLACTGSRQVSRRELMAAIACFSDALSNRGIELAGSLDAMQPAVETALGLFRVRGLVEIERPAEVGGEQIYHLPDQKRAPLEFYRNSLVNYLWPESLVATILLMRDESSGEMPPGMSEDFRFLKELLSNELIVDPLVRDEDLIEATLGFFRAKGWWPAREQSDGGLAGTRALEYFRGILSDLLGVYYLVLVGSDLVQDDSVGQKDFIKKMGSTAHTHFPEDHDRAAPSLASVTVANALKRLGEMGVLEYSAGRKVLVGINDLAERDRLREYLARLLGRKT